MLKKGTCGNQGSRFITQLSLQGEWKPLVSFTADPHKPTVRIYSYSGPQPVHSLLDKREMVNQLLNKQVTAVRIWLNTGSSGESQSNLSWKGCLGDFWVTFHLVLWLDAETGQRMSLGELSSLHQGSCLGTPTPSPPQLRHRWVWVHQLCTSCPGGSTQR